MSRKHKLPPLAEQDARRIANVWFRWGKEKAKKIFQQVSHNRKMKRSEAVIADYIKQLYKDL